MRGRFNFFFKYWQYLNFSLLRDITNLWLTSRFSRLNILYLIKYASFILVPYFKISSVFGFSVLLAIVIQFISGLFLAFYYVPDPSFVITFREEYQNEIWYYFWIYKAHVVGVDCLFILSYIHLFKKIWIKNFIESDIDGWYSGSFSFIVFHVVVFFGITLSTNHLGDVTVTIAANIFWSLLNRLHKSYCIFFSNKHLNVDLLVKFSLAHYILAFYYSFLVQIHIMYIHESWDSESEDSSQQDSITPKISWFWDSIMKEISTMWSFYLILALAFIWIATPDYRVINFSFFEQWSETEVEEINFFIVSPHWYFRAHMGLLTVCAQHYEGLFWLVSFYIILAILPNIYRFYNGKYNINNLSIDFTPSENSTFQFLLYLLFISSIIYVASVLPCGRFYYEAVDGFFGNILFKLSYQYIYIYLLFLMHYSEKLEKKIILFFFNFKKIYLFFTNKIKKIL